MFLYLKNFSQSIKYEDLKMLSEVLRIHESDLTIGLIVFCAYLLIMVIDTQLVPLHMLSMQRGLILVLIYVFEATMSNYDIRLTSIFKIRL